MLSLGLVVCFLTGQDNRGNHEQDRDGAGGTSFDSEDSGSFPSSDSNPGGRYAAVPPCLTCAKLVHLLCTASWNVVGGHEFYGGQAGVGIWVM